MVLNVFRRPVLKRFSVSGEAFTTLVSELTDTTGVISRRYGLNQQAGTVFVNRQGRVVARLPDGSTAETVLRALRKTPDTFSP